MRLSIRTALLAAALGCAAPAAFAQTFVADLTGAAEVPPVQTQGSGALTASLEGSTLRYRVEFRNLTGPVTAAHFHGPAGAAENAPPIIHLTPSPSPIVGEAELTAEQAADLKAGRWYLNLHTTAHRPGEIRGQVAARP